MNEPLEDRLRRFSPDGSCLDRDALLFAAGKASARLLQEPAVDLRLKQSGAPRLKERLAKLTAGLPPADQRLQDLLIRRPFLVIHFNKFPADYSLSVDHVGRRVGPPFAVGIRMP